MDKKSDYSSLTTEVIDVDMQTFMFEKFNEDEPKDEKEEDKKPSKTKSKQPNQTIEALKGIALGLVLLGAFIVADQMGYFSF